MTVFEIERDILNFANKVVQYTEKNSDKNVEELMYDYNYLCCNVLFYNDMTENLKEFLFSIVYRLIYFTNDVANATATATNTSADYELTYKMIHELNCTYEYLEGEGESHNDFYQPLLKQLAKKAFTDITATNLQARPLDCWKYMPDLLHYIYYNNMYEQPDEDDIIFHHHIIDTMVTRLLVDSVKVQLGMTPSTLAFWLPKEKSKQFGYLTHPISYHLFSNWIKTATAIAQPSSLDRAKTKCLTHYRKLITEIKTQLDVDTLRALKTEVAPVTTVAKKKYTSYAYLLSDLCKENFIVAHEDMSKLWETILYDDMPGLISALDKDKDEDEDEDKDEDEDEEDEDEEDEDEEEDAEIVDTPPVPNTGWFSWLW